MATDKLITEPQKRAILAIAARVFGREHRDEDLPRLIKVHFPDATLDTLMLSQASTLIDRLRELMVGAKNNGTLQKVVE